MIQWLGATTCDRKILELEILQLSIVGHAGIAASVPFPPRSSSSWISSFFPAGIPPRCEYLIYDLVAGSLVGSRKGTFHFWTSCACGTGQVEDSKGCGTI